MSAAAPTQLLFLLEDTCVVRIGAAGRSKGGMGGRCSSSVCDVIAGQCGYCLQLDRHIYSQPDLPSQLDH